MYPHGLQHKLVANEDLEVDHVARSDTKKKKNVNMQSIL